MEKIKIKNIKSGVLIVERIKAIAGNIDSYHLSLFVVVNSYVFDPDLA